MKLTIAKEGIPYGLVLLAVTAALFFISVPAALVSALLTGFVLYFFRDPQKRTDPKPGEILSPSYGTVVEVSENKDFEYLGGKGTKIGIFLSVFDVHMNYAPADGVVTYLRHQKGKFCNALKAKASEINECNSIGIQGKNGDFVVKQIAGLIARRIVCPVRKGTILNAGEKIGLIQFGSRVDIWLPAGIEINVKKGDRVQGGVTVIGVRS